MHNDPIYLLMALIFILIAISLIMSGNKTLSDDGIKYRNPYDLPPTNSVRPYVEPENISDLPESKTSVKPVKRSQRKMPRKRKYKRDTMGRFC